MTTPMTTDTLPGTGMRSAGDFDAVWRDIAQTRPDLWTIAQEPLSGLFSTWEPQFALTEQEDAYLLRAKLPGIQRDDMTVECDNGTLTVRGEQSIEADASQDGPHIQYGSRAFARRFNLAMPVDVHALAITYTPDGLEVYLPKVVDAFAQPIPVQAA